MNKSYVDLKGGVHHIGDLDAGERRLLTRIHRKADACSDWNAFDNFWLGEVAPFYSARGYSRLQIIETTIYRIAQDLGSRIGIAAGLVRLSDYRDQLADIVRRDFRTQGDFCKATGLSPAMLSHVLAGRKHLAIDTLAKALERIGYTLRIAPLPAKATRDHQKARA